MENLLGPDLENAKLKEHLSLEKHVGAHTPPVFLWHTQEDETVPVENSFMFAQELQRHHIQFEFHMYPFGAHGASLATKETETPEQNRYADPHVATWLNLSSQWLSLLFQRL
jgi:dipeptidyl aminopeptidase/acylaminoacyl peptidase